MAKFKKRQSLKDDITASDFMGKGSMPVKIGMGDDDITVGLSIEEIQDSTKNLVMFKNITTGQLMGVTENDDKRAILLSHLHQWKEQAGWIAGRLLFEIQKKIEQDYNSWASKGEKEENKPEYTTFKQWIERYGSTMSFGVSTANQYIWLYKNVEFEKAELGVKKQKLIQQIQDPIKREKIEEEAFSQKLTVKALQEKIEKIEKNETEKIEKEKKIEKINYQIITEKDEVKIHCDTNDVHFIAMAIMKLEKQIKLYAQTEKASSPEKNETNDVKSIREKAKFKKTLAMPNKVKDFILDNIKEEDKIETMTLINTRERNRAEARREAFYEVLAIVEKDLLGES